MRFGGQRVIHSVIIPLTAARLKLSRAKLEELSAEFIDRSIEIQAESGVMIRVCSAEDLIVMKAFADREIDWHDIRGIVVRQGIEKINWQLIKKTSTAVRG